MNISHLAAPRALAPLHGLWRWLSHMPASQSLESSVTLDANHAFSTSPPLTTKCHLEPAFAGVTAVPLRKPLRIIRVLEPNHAPANVGRMLISGCMADVCAELDRLAAKEAALH
jgi:hypothetical protein